MNHKGTVELKTERLILRKFTLQDVPAAFANWTSSQAVTEFLRWPAHENTTLTEQVLGEWITLYNNKNFYQWAIALKETDQPIGSIGVVA